MIEAERWIGRLRGGPVLGRHLVVLRLVIEVLLRRVLLACPARRVWARDRRLRRRLRSAATFSRSSSTFAAARSTCSTLVGAKQAEAAAAGVGAIVEALWRREMDRPRVWLAEQVIEPKPFLERLAAHGIRLIMTDPTAQGAASNPHPSRATIAAP
jgi:hypothetical protein